MARIRKHRRADGGTSYQVRWVLGGGAGAGSVEKTAASYPATAFAVPAVVCLDQVFQGLSLMLGHPNPPRVGCVDDPVSRPPPHASPVLVIGTGQRVAASADPPDPVRPGRRSHRAVTRETWLRHGLHRKRRLHTPANHRHIHAALLRHPIQQHQVCRLPTRVGGRGLGRAARVGHLDRPQQPGMLQFLVRQSVGAREERPMRRGRGAR